VKLFESLKAKIITTIIVVLLIGIAIPKLTVHDLVPVDTLLKQCVNIASNLHYDNPIENVALFFGKSRIIAATPTSAEIESFTLFRIPLGILRGQPGMKTNIFCNPAGDWSATNVTDSFLPLPEKLPAGWYAHRTSDTSFFITLQKNLPNIGATEGYAYGDQVGVSLSTTTLTPQVWVTGQQWLDDTALIISKNWVEAHGHTMLQVEHQTEASPELTDYLFVGNRVYTITLYPDKGAGLSDNVLGAMIDKYAGDPAYKIISDVQARTNCENLTFANDEQKQYTYVDSVTGIVTVGYLTKKNESKIVLLNYQNDYNYSGCSADAHALLSTIKEQQDKYDADMMGQNL
jgi:hypothetical protein